MNVFWLYALARSICPYLCVKHTSTMKNSNICEIYRIFMPLFFGKSFRIAHITKAEYSVFTPNDQYNCNEFRFAKKKTILTDPLTVNIDIVYHLLRHCVIPQIELISYRHKNALRFPLLKLRSNTAYLNEI